MQDFSTLTFLSVHFEFVRYEGSLSYGCYDSFQSIYLGSIHVPCEYPTNRLLRMSVICRWKIENLNNSRTKYSQTIWNIVWRVQCSHEQRQITLKSRTPLNGAWKKNYLYFYFALPVKIFQILRRRKKLSKNRAARRKTLIRKRFVIRAILRLRRYN